MQCTNKRAGTNETRGETRNTWKASEAPFLGRHILLGGGKKWGGRGKGGRRPPLLVQFGPEGEGRAAHPGRPSLSPLWPISPITSPEGVPVTLRHFDFLRNHPEHFQCPNIAVQYINLYFSTISRLLIMSVIIFGTPNYLRYIETQKLVIQIIIER